MNSMMEEQIDYKKLPKHIGIIMDGNGRWARQRGKPRVWGHKMGAKTVKIITEECAKLKKIEQLTLYAFSYENWQRPKKEIEYLMSLLRRFLIKERETILKNNIKFEAIGRLEMLPDKVIKELEKTKELSKNNTGMILCLALSYGGRIEIVDMIKSIAKKVKEGHLKIEDINENLCSYFTYKPNMLPVDLLIRTGGEMRISNFLLWHIHYAELWITPVLWPDFRKEHLYQALKEFSKRERKFGKVLSPV